MKIMTSNGEQSDSHFEMNPLEKVLSDGKHSNNSKRLSCRYYKPWLSQPEMVGNYNFRKCC